MKSQYILIFTLIIISIISYYFLQISKIEKFSKEDALEYIKNFEEEIKYISKNFNKSFILDFINLYKYYSSLNNLQMNFICIISEKFYDPSKIPECTIVNENCCYVIRSALYIGNELKYCNISFLIKDYDIVCLCYNFSRENNFYVGFLCI